MGIKIIGTGCHIPSRRERNEDFGQHEFLTSDGKAFPHSTDTIIEKFQAITGIAERRYAENHYTASDLAFFAAEKAIADSGKSSELLDYIIVAHNFGDVKHGGIQTDQIPSLASRVKHLLGIANPRCVTYDLIFGCPGWVEGLIHATAFIKSGMAKNCLVIGSETLSRVVDRHDRDSMIYSDGAGAAWLSLDDISNSGIISHLSASYTREENKHLYYGPSYHPEKCSKTSYLKMDGRKIYEFALNKVSQAMKDCLDASEIPIYKLKKIFLHQANEKMDFAITKQFYKLYGLDTPPGILPMNIGTLGNSSVATIPTLFDQVRKEQIEGQYIDEGDIIMFASVGAGMNINALVYRV